ncbi:aspartyl-tRNA synthetase [Gregarina niphandrodes]|uniref:aspartate--tRNA ligase n=1 Tax=Gregarina niphandrodes TaxID=110365 RepID=A0A023B9F7_GRENI|nr:aspartyl-tRNA synthetase [Gregarina niphandrodes]EZG72878.1 aspartyl-tRNA synthetase [Gregarina niphandrodes]|eukprot:XP_011129737.1 aspartyl-tRNA synthetase [Gregarina niphandrodes]
MEGKTTDEPAKAVTPDMSAEDKKKAKEAKKQAEKAAKEAKKAEREAQLAEQRRAAEAVLCKTVADVNVDTYGNLGVINSATKSLRVWTTVSAITPSLTEQGVWVRGRIAETRCKSKSLAFIVLRQQTSTVQCVMSATTEDEKDAIKFLASLPLESIVDVYGTVTIPPVPITSTTQPVELAITRCHCVSKSLPELPFQLKDANRPESEMNEEGAVQVSQDTRLDNRILDLRTLAMNAVMKISSEVCTLFSEYLSKEGFVQIHSPKLIGGASEGGANVFKLKYFERDACLAQSPQLYKQMAISADLDRVFEIGPVFRAENSNTHRHLCEFVGLDMEMAFKEHYFEVLEVIENTFCFIFKGLEERCQKEIEAVHRQWPAEPFKWGNKVLRLEFSEGCKMLREAGFSDIPDDISQFDIGTEQEKALGKLVKAKYDTDFYYMINYPLGVRPFYTMPHPTDPSLSNSYDFFMRGEEIVSGAQRVHDPELLTERAQKLGIEVSTIKSYIDSFRLGAHPHAGCGIGLERVVMLFLGLNNIRKVSMFPRDPKRLTP